MVLTVNSSDIDSLLAVDFGETTGACQILTGRTLIMKDRKFRCSMPHAVMLRVFSIFTLLMLAVIFTGSVSATPMTPATQARSAHSVETPEVPLYSGLHWQSLGPLEQRLTINNEVVTLHGTAYQSEEFKTKLPIDIFTYYAEQLAPDGWIEVEGAGGIGALVDTYYRTQMPHRYLVVQLVHPIVSEGEAPRGSYLYIWVSSLNPKAAAVVLTPTPNTATPQPTSPPPTQASTVQPVAPAIPNVLSVPLFSQRDGSWDCNRMGWEGACGTGCSY